MTGIAGYANRVSAAPGETIDFMVSAEAATYRCDIVRIVCGDENPDGPGFIRCMHTYISHTNEFTLHTCSVCVLDGLLNN